MVVNSKRLIHTIWLADKHQTNKTWHFHFIDGCSQPLVVHPLVILREFAVRVLVSSKSVKLLK